MLDTHKVTVHLPPEILDDAIHKTSEGMTSTIQDALKRLAHKRACKGLLALRGKVKFKYTAAELRGDE